MATEGEEAEYESDPEEAILSLAMRRREASDDEEEERRDAKPVTRGGIVADDEIDGQGGANFYEDDEALEIEQVGEEEEDEEELEEDDEEEYYGELEEERGSDNGAVKGSGAVAVGVVETVAVESLAVSEVVEAVGKNEVDGEAKKENEPYAVPTAGAFYMHDDRFQENGHGRHRRTFGGRKLWESKDNQAWVHDRFEEMNLEDERYDEEKRRNGKGRFRGRGGGRGGGRGFGRGNRARLQYGTSNNQNHNYKVVRGRGPRRYDSQAKNIKEMPAAQERLSGKPINATSHSNSGKAPVNNTSTGQPDPVLPGKHVFASSLNYASPPFYPSGSSNQDGSNTQTKDMQSASSNKNIQSSVLNEYMSTSHSAPLMRGKTINESSGLERSLDSVIGKQLKNLQLQPTLLNTRQSAQTSNSVRGPVISAQRGFSPSSSFAQVSSSTAQTPISSIQQRSVQSPVQPSLQGSTQQIGLHTGGGSQASMSQPPSSNLSDNGEIESPPGSSKSKIPVLGKGKDGSQGSGKGSFLYGGAQLIGATGPTTLAHGDQGFSATPALLPVMQFGGHHPGGIGVPAVGMALPGYVAQPQLGFGNSEMTWVPVLAGAAGALGASYCSPYIAVDGGYYARSSGQTSSLGGSKETASNRPNNTLKPSPKAEVVGEEFGQRQNKPRRYSEMNFSQ